MPKLVLGVDPGFTGALVLIDPRERTIKAWTDMPVSLKPNGKREIDQTKLALWLDEHGAEISLAVIEEVGAMPKQGLSSTFRFGYGAGVVAGIIAANYIPTFFTPPQVWKALMGLNSDKALSLEKAKKLFPQSENIFSRRKDDGRAEAALLALFGADRLLR